MDWRESYLETGENQWEGDEDEVKRDKASHLLVLNVDCKSWAVAPFQNYSL